MKPRYRRPKGRTGPKHRHVEGPTRPISEPVPFFFLSCQLYGLYWLSLVKKGKENSALLACLLLGLQ